MPKTVEISHRTIIFTVLFLLSLWFVYQIKDIILLLFVAVILMSALTPFVDWLQKYHIPRGLAIFFIYLFVWALAGSLIATVIPGLIDQSGKLIRVLPVSLSQIELFNTHQQEISQEILARLGSLPEGLIKFSVGLFSNILGVVTTLVISFYLLLERNKLDRYLALLLGPDKPEKAKRIINEIEHRLGRWVRGELFLMIAVGTFTYFGLVILGVDIPLPLAVLAGLLEIVPNIGPTISAVPAILVALTINPLTALATLALYILIQQLENNLLVPKVMEKATGVNPLVSILALMVGFKIAGPAGAVLSIPIILVAQIIAAEVFSSHRLEGLTQ
ncbi:AI-2E family transporter [Candidatus Amesbacteria bacterium]|nr:AI-2E family transporter [Candidatus Amesbacteria bacterium]